MPPELLALPLLIPLYYLMRWGKRKQRELDALNRLDRYRRTAQVDHADTLTSTSWIRAYQRFPDMREEAARKVLDYPVMESIMDGLLPITEL